MVTAIQFGGKTMPRTDCCPAGTVPQPNSSKLLFRVILFLYCQICRRTDKYFLSGFVYKLRIKYVYSL